MANSKFNCYGYLKLWLVPKRSLCTMWLRGWESVIRIIHQTYFLVSAVKNGFHCEFRFCRSVWWWSLRDILKLTLIMVPSIILRFDEWKRMWVFATRICPRQCLPNANSKIEQMQQIYGVHQTIGNATSGTGSKEVYRFSPTEYL